MRRLFLVVVAATAVALGAGAFAGTAAQGSDCTDCVRLNQVQVLGTHNSYHLAPYDPLLDLIAQIDPNAAIAFDYSHRSLTEQLGLLGVRQVELDVFADPGPVPLFAAPIGEAAILGPSSVPIASMIAPGEKVLHIQDIDYRSTCATLVACLQEIDAWSDANPNHLPILILIEAKDDPLALPPALPGVGAIPPAAVPVPIGAAELQSIDDVIRSVFGPDEILTPDDVRGSHATLEAAILADGWPTLDDVRGQVLFALDNEDSKRDAYRAGHPSLEGRAMFTSSAPGSPDAAFVKVNDPVAGFAQIQALVTAGYLVRTRADADTVEARYGVTGRRDAALSSGAHFISTDYPEADPALGTGYSVDIPGGEVGRCNPVTGAAGCDAALFENPPAATPTPTTVPPGPPSTGTGSRSDPGAFPWEAVLIAATAVVASALATAAAWRR